MSTMKAFAGLIAALLTAVITNYLPEVNSIAGFTLFGTLDTLINGIVVGAVGWYTVWQSPANKEKA